MKRFDLLKEYYRECFELFDKIHFNSNVAQAEFHKYFLPKKEIVLPITHLGISDNRVYKTFDENCTRLGFIGNETIYKGLPLLLEVLREIDLNKWHLDVWGGHVGKEDDIPVSYNGKYNNEMLKSVYDTMELLIVPSVWKETFSLVALEALSFGVPVLVSDNVGAQIIVNEYDSRFVYHEKDGLKKILQTVINDKTLLYEYNKKIVKQEWHHSMIEHTKHIIEKIYET